MSESLTIQGYDGYRLHLDRPVESQYTAQLTGRDVSAKTAVYHRNGDGIDGFFVELAERWRGWDGDRKWESLEGGLSFSAAMARTGVVTLRVELKDDPMWTWRCVCQLNIDNGALDSLAMNARAFGETLRQSHYQDRAH